MKISSFDLSFIKAFKSVKFNIEETRVLIGQNDHGKSSILKSINIVLNEIDNESLDSGTLHPDIGDLLLPIFQVNAKARRITINYEAGPKTKKQIHITVRSDLSFTVLEKIERNAKTSATALGILKKLRENNQFLMIPAVRDASSENFKELFARTLRAHGLNLIPKKAGGTQREYRTLREIQKSITEKIQPYINETLLPRLQENFGFTTQHELALKLDIDVHGINEWIMENLRLGFSIEGSNIPLALSEAGSGVQSGVLLALHRMEQQAAAFPEKNFILAIEEPEAFLHPQKQRELYSAIKSSESKNLRVLVTTHSPYIVADTPFSRIGLVKREGQHSALHIAEIKSPKEQEIFNSYGNEINSLIFFADKVIIVEGESDLRVLKLLLHKKYGNAAHRISIISASGNKNFSPFLNMIKAWSSANIRHLVVTDFDSLTKDSDRAILIGAREAGYAVANHQALCVKIDAALDKNETDYENACIEASVQLAAVGLNTFIFSSDLEYSLINNENKTAAAKVLNSVSTGDNDYSTGYDLTALRKQIGSKCIPLNGISKPTFKKPFIHQKIADTIAIDTAHPDIQRLFVAIDAL